MLGLAFFLSPQAKAEQVNLKLHHFLPPQGTVPKNFMVPWAKKIAKESGGKINIQLFPSMQLGGKPPALFDQAKDGMVDIVWTLTGYTPGRFTKAEVFELPFMVSNAENTSKAAWEYYEQNLQEEFKDVKVLAIHTHGPGLFHSKKPISQLSDLKGMKLRGPTRYVNSMLKSLGATAIGMPIPAAPQALAKGVIDGVVIPWEVVPVFKIPELVGNHTVFEGDRGLYTAVFILAMNKAKYEGLPADLKKVIDDNSGIHIAGQIGAVMDKGDIWGLGVTKKTKNNFVTVPANQLGPWKEASKVVAQEWIADMKKKNLDGQKLYDSAVALVAKHSAK